MRLTDAFDNIHIRIGYTYQMLLGEDISDSLDPELVAVRSRFEDVARASVRSIDVTSRRGGADDIVRGYCKIETPGAVYTMGRGHHFGANNGVICDAELRVLVDDLTMESEIKFSVLQKASLLNLDTEQHMGFLMWELFTNRSILRPQMQCPRHLDYHR